MKPSAKTRILKVMALLACLAIFATIGGAFFIGSEVRKSFTAIENDWTEFRDISEQKIRFLSLIQTSLGYGGFIHHFSAMILKSDTSYLSSIETDFDTVRNSIASYNLLPINNDEASALATLRRLVADYDLQAINAARLIDEGATPADIADQMVVDDTEVRGALDQLRWAWTQEAQSTGTRLTASSVRSHEVTSMGAIFLPILIAIGIFLVWLVIRLLAQINLFEEEKKALEASERKFRDIAATVPGVIFQWQERHHEKERGYAYVSPRSEDLFGVNPEELTQDWQALDLHPEDLQNFHDSLQQAIEQDQEWSFEGRIKSPDGDYKWGRALSLPVRGDQDDITFNGIIVDVTHQKRLESELRRLATTDPLTGGNNRRHFMDVAEKELARSIRYNHPLTVCMLDIDHFKSINDTFSHAGGDEALKGFVTILQACLRDTDTMGRMGGEEFAVIMPETGLKGAAMLAERIRQAVERLEITWDEKTIRFTVSIGISQHNEGEKSVDDMLNRADEALYFAKKNGRNRLATLEVDGDTPYDAMPTESPAA